MGGTLVSPGQIYTSTCMSGAGYTEGESIRAAAVSTASNIRAAAAAIIAADNAAQLIENYRDQRDIARRMNTIARETQDQLRNHFWPAEEQFLAEFSEPEPLEEVEVLGRRYAGRLISTVAKQFAEQLRVARCNLNRYCTSANKKALQDLLLARSNAFGAARVTGRNLAFTEFRARTDQNYKRRLQAASWGMGMSREAASLYASAFGAYQAAGQSIAARFNENLGQLGASLRMGQQARMWGATINTIQEQQRGNPGFYAPTYSQTSFGYQSVSGNISNVNASNVIEWSQPHLDRGADTSNLFGNSQQQMWNVGQNMGNEDFIRTGIVSFPVIGMTGGTVLVDMDSFPIMNAKHKQEGLFS